LIGGSVHFGTVDCTVHHRICNQHGINAYPTTIFFNESRPHRYQGSHDAEELADFVKDVLRPTVVELTEDNFDQLVGQKSEVAVGQARSLGVLKARSFCRASYISTLFQHGPPNVYRGSG
jgi:thioredoxin-like negative regulator of GroEL